MRERDYMARGMAEADARRAATRRLGDLGQARAECIAITSRRERRMTRAQVVDAFVHDVKFAWRTLGRQKGWTAVAVITLALGIGANTAVFSVVNTLLLHPLPYPNADRVAFVWHEKDSALVTSKIEALIACGWIPVALMGVAASDGHLLARPLVEHERGDGIHRYLKRLMDGAAKQYEGDFGDPPTPTLH